MKVIMEAIHEHMYRKVYESRDSEEETEIRNVYGKCFYQKNDQEYGYYSELSGATKWKEKQHKYTEHENAKSGEIGYFAKLNRSKQKVKLIHHETRATTGSR